MPAIYPANPTDGGSLGLFDEFERRLERVVDGFFSKAFRSPIQPAEFGRRLMREMEGGKTVSVGAVYVPNAYTIHLCPEDYDRFEGLIPALQTEFGTLLVKNAEERRWHLAGVISVTFQRDPGIAKSGRFEVSAAHDAAAQAPAPPPGPRQMVRLLTASPPETYALTGTRLTIGRLPACEITLNDANASRQHAEIVSRDGDWWIVDLGSTNGTLVNGNLIRERRLAPGDRIDIGSSRLEFGVEEPPKPQPPEPASQVSDATQAAFYPFDVD